MASPQCTDIYEIPVLATSHLTLSWGTEAAWCSFFTASHHFVHSPSFHLLVTNQISMSLSHLSTSTILRRLVGLMIILVPHPFVTTQFLFSLP